MNNVTTKAGEKQASSQPQYFTTKEFAAEINLRGLELSSRTLEGWRISRNGKEPKLRPARYEGKQALYTAAQVELVVKWLSKGNPNLFANEDNDAALESYTELTTLNQSDAPPVESLSEDATTFEPVENAQNDLATNGQPAPDLNIGEKDSTTPAAQIDSPADFDSESIEGTAAVPDICPERESAAMKALNVQAVVVEDKTFALTNLDSAIPATEDNFKNFVLAPLSEKSTDELIYETQYCLRKSIQSVIGAGRRLLELKKRVKHGDWQKWVEANLSVKYRTAAYFMQIAEKFCGENQQLVAHLSYSACLALLPLTNEEIKAFAEEEKVKGNSIETQSKDELKKNVKNFKQVHKPAPDDEDDQQELPGKYFDALGLGREVPPDIEPTPESIPEPTFEPQSQSAETKEDPSQNKKPYTGNPEWYTAEKYIEAARNVLGGIDLDPASSEIAQQTVKAAKYFTASDNGLQHEWHGRIWLNPPYKKELIEPFVDKFISEYTDGKIGSNVTAAIILVRNATETAWFQKLAQHANVICFTNHRPKFYRPDGTFGNGDPRDGAAFFYFGNEVDKFRRSFEQFGWFATFIPVAQGEV